MITLTGKIVQNIISWSSELHLVKSSGRIFPVPLHYLLNKKRGGARKCGAPKGKSNPDKE